ncbi:alpha/beta hydrolase fold domain-containing protein [Streptomyces sp. NPDC002589]|uniref:alpha/beta hydrolase fold domain-containing protein n=1 Tax=Streptomyces sp. NPDC002589 TaxID=3154420 RepID=UPI0033170D38
MDRFVRALIRWQVADRPAPARTLTVAQLRSRYADSAARWSQGAAPQPVAAVTDEQIEGQGGRFGVRTYVPMADRGRLVTYLHGGGWTVGDVDTHDRVCRRIAAALAAVVVSVDYRRAPEHPHPGPLKDGIAAAAWAGAAFPGRDHVIAGDSAGAALALGIAMHHRDQGGPAFAAQLLFYPPLDPHMRSKSLRTYAVGYLTETDDLRWYYEQYLPDPRSRTDPAVDLLDADHRGLPPTVIATAAFDPLHDEGVELAARLAARGVAVQHVPAPDQVHGYLLMADMVPSAAAAMHRVLAAAERALTLVPATTERADRLDPARETSM